ncbi:MAG: N-acetylmuramoyl-L-alanine amidase, partial [Clostridia bacterium]|nr:N-acetylmuramoyl-L-alanine amidase [Clostridia bacterium]
DDSRQIALEIQSSVKSLLQLDNSREPKEAGSSIYILKNAQTPAVLVECGFLSNHADLVNLTDPSYRAALACFISAPIFEYTVRK